MKSDKEASKSSEEGSRSSYSELPENEDSSPSKVATKKESKKSNKENREIRILRRSKTLKDKNDPDRFSGGGINFKAKIIGTEHVFDARGNRMCQGALQRLKAAVKTSGDHKQRIILNISYEGIVIMDEKTGEVLHHHPIHKISFISQDTVDKRSFGYVFGCPQTGHEFFGIKTEKIASQVVLTLRDLFLAALEIKKKEIESAKETQKDSENVTVQENGSSKVSTNGISGATNSTVNIDGASNHKKTLHDELLYSNTVLLPDENTVHNDKQSSPPTEPVVDNLLDLQFTVDNLQMGISQMDHSIATAVSHGFGLSFSEDDISESSNSSLPVSFHHKMDKISSLYQETLSISSRSSSTSDYNFSVTENKTDDIETLKKDFALPFTASDYRTNSSSISKLLTNQISCSSPTEVTSSQVPSSPPSSEEKISQNAIIASAALSEAASKPAEDRYAVFLEIDALPSIFDNPAIVQTSSVKEVSHFNEELTDDCNKHPPEILPQTPETLHEVKTSTPVVFAELDPLGNQPYVDKRDFFQDIKNPPKKVLKDLAGCIESSDSIDVPSNDTENTTATAVSSELLQLYSDPSSEIPSNSSEQRQVNPFAINTNTILSRAVPKLPPKRSMSVAAPSCIPDNFVDPIVTNEDQKWEVKNPFNPFVEEDFPDIPPPSSPPPPPPPPRLPVKGCEISPVVSPPPPRPPSRSNGIPTPPLPKRKPQLASSGKTWFSFDQEALSFPPVNSSSNIDPVTDPYVPPIPSPARKFPPSKAEPSTLKSASPSNSPSFRRSLHQGAVPNPVVKENNLKLNNSPRKTLLHHSSLILENDSFSGSVNLFAESHHITESAISEEDVQMLDSPPLPPKPLSIARPRPSPSKKMLSSVHCSSLSSHSSSSASAVESSNGIHSSSSLVFSSSDDGKLGSSAEALYVRSSESHSDVFSQNSLETSNEQSSTFEPTNDTCELSPDSIFRRKSDPFADDFFLSLPKKSSCKNKPNVESMQKTCSNGVDLHLENFEATT